MLMVSQHVPLTNTSSNKNPQGMQDENSGVYDMTQNNPRALNDYFGFTLKDKLHKNICMSHIYHWIAEHF